MKLAKITRHIVQFNDDRFALRKNVAPWILRWIVKDYYYLDLKIYNQWWPKHSAYFRECTTFKRGLVVAKAIENMDPGEPVKNLQFDPRDMEIF